jgi:hypothetical protein
MDAGFAGKGEALLRKQLADNTGSLILERPDQSSKTPELQIQAGLTQPRGLSPSVETIL